jgi:hypothetical protein
VIWLLLAQLLTSFAYPISHGFAQQLERDIVLTITYTEQSATRVCITSYAIADTDMQYAIETRCLTPSSPIGDVDVWKDRRLDQLNFLVTITYDDGHVDPLYIWKRIDT